MHERVALPRPSRRHRQGVTRSDVRWLMAWLGVFTLAILLLLAAHQVYRLTGPHPQMTMFMRSLKHYARWLIPGQKSGPRSERAPLPGEPPASHYAGSSEASGHEAQRA